jgi:hypothetical protein
MRDLAVEKVRREMTSTRVVRPALGGSAGLGTSGGALDMAKMDIEARMLRNRGPAVPPRRGGNYYRLSVS